MAHVLLVDGAKYYDDATEDNFKLSTMLLSEIPSSLYRMFSQVLGFRAISEEEGNAITIVIGFLGLVVEFV